MNTKREYDKEWLQTYWHKEWLYICKYMKTSKLE